MKSAIDEFGWDNIQHNVLFEHLTKEEAEEIEIQLIEKYETTNINFGYNTAFGGLETTPMKRVAQYDLQGNFINQFSSVREASKIVGCQETSIALVCRQSGEQKQTGGFMWRYIEAGNVQLKITPYSTERGKFINSKNKPRMIIQFDGNKKEIKKWCSIKDAANHINRNPSSIIGAIKEEYKCGGFYWKYYKEEE